MFKRRNPQSYGEAIGRAIYPRGGWRRASRYIAYRLRRLPDPAHKISRGIAAGVFSCFTPFFGLHFVTAAAITWALRGNVLAALLATFFGNPVTFPVIATISVEAGTWMLGRSHIPLQEVLLGFSLASVELWQNFQAIFTSDVAVWSNMSAFFQRIFLPYLVGGIVPGLATATAAYWLSYPIILSYQRGRIAAVKDRFDARRLAIDEVRAERAAREADEAATEEAAGAAWAEVRGGDDDK